MSSLLIAPFQSGWITSVDPWLAPLDSFPVIRNVEVRRGYIQKRRGRVLLFQLEKKLPIVGILSFMNTDGTPTLLVFDTSSSYILENSQPKPLDTNSIFEGTSRDFVLGTQWHGDNQENRLYFTNGLPLINNLNGLRYYSGEESSIAFSPSTGGGNTIQGAKFIFSLNGRLVLLGTYEGSSSLQFFGQRARWCARSNPNNWVDTVAGGGDFSEAATGESIMSAQLLKNQIVVFFPSSTWLLVPTGDPHKAFVWTQVNGIQGGMSRCGSVAFDNTVATLSFRGIFSCDGIQMQRIDHKILDFCNGTLNSAAASSLFCFRSSTMQQWWTLYANRNSETNNKVLVWDEESNAFFTFDYALNCLGEGIVSKDWTLADFVGERDWTLQDFGEQRLQDFAFDYTGECLLGGDIQGNLFQLQESDTDNGNSIPGEVWSAQWMPFKEQGYSAKLVYIDLLVDCDAYSEATLSFFKNTENVSYKSTGISFLPDLHFQALIQNIKEKNGNVYVLCPQHGLTSPQTIWLYGVKSPKALNGEGFSMEIVDDNTLMLLNLSLGSFLYGGGGGVYRAPVSQTKCWTRIYGGGSGFCHQLKISFSSDSPFRIHAFRPYFEPTGSRLIN